MLEFGCGPGNVARQLLERWPRLTYVGYDRSQAMVELAADTVKEGAVSFVPDWNLVANSSGEGFDAALISFVLHDVDDHLSVLSQLAETLHRPGSILIADLSTWDLPRLAALLRIALARPLSLPDPRLDAPRVLGWSDRLGAGSIELSVAAPSITFPSLRGVADFVSVFGIDKGADMPLSIAVDGSDGSRLRRALARTRFPFEDRRSFLLARLRFE